MYTRKMYLSDVTRQLLLLDYEITLLKFRVEEAIPEVMRECYGQVRGLLEQYELVEAQVRDLEEMPEDAWTDHCAEVDRALGQLLNLFLLARSWITMRLSQPVRSQTFSDSRAKGSARSSRPAARIRRRRKHELPQLIEQSNGRKLWF